MHITRHQIAIYTHTDCLKHDTGLYHPEHSERLQVILQTLKISHLAQSLIFQQAPCATEEDICLAHEKSYLNSLLKASPITYPINLDEDTVLSPKTLTAAFRAVGAGLAAVDDILSEKHVHAFCAVRPPGHHATRTHAMGFCIFNNIAIAALYAIQRKGLSRVAIVDFDVHHGNGTQDIIKTENRILYISTHQSPLYPGTGFVEENQANHIINVPMSAGTSGETYRGLFSQKVISPLEAFSPQLLLISAGFDAHAQDPLAGLRLLEDDYLWIGQQLAAVSAKHEIGSISFLEGGYNLNHLGLSVEAYLEGLSLRPVFQN